MDGGNVKKLLEVKEFDKIICNADYKYDDRYKYIEPEIFDKLKSFICEFAVGDNNTDVLDFMRISFKRNFGYFITIRNYVGLIQINDNYQLQVLPKISFDNEEDVENRNTKRIFLKMLCSMKDFSGKVFNNAYINSGKMNLYEIFINMYLQEVRELIKHGIQSTYIRQEENLPYCKGKLIVNKQIRYNILHKEHFYVEHDEFLQDRPENRLIKATLLKLQRQTSSAKNNKEIRQVLTAFEMVKPSINYQKDFSQSIIDRNTQNYRTLISWSEIFLMNKSFTTFSGDKNAKAMLFPMEKVYESYVACQVKKVFGLAGWNVTSQDRGYYLFNYKNDKLCRQFGLRPDIVLRKDSYIVVMDTKWKRLENNPKTNYGIKQADMYQMYAYSKKYKTSDVWLLYPVNEKMCGKEQIFFNSGDGTNVKLHFVDLNNIEDNMKELLEKVEMSAKLL